MRVAVFLVFLFLAVLAHGSQTEQEISRLIDELAAAGPIMETRAQCVDRVCIGGVDAARDDAHLRELGITHVVSAIGGPERFGRAYLVLKLYDAPWQRLDDAFARSHAFITAALASHENARVLVHCAAGISRSASLVIHHLMLSRRWSYDDALAAVRAVRPIVEPNSGFERQLRAIVLPKEEA
jgi:hypothetical protein